MELDYEYFRLSPDSSDKDLNNAYRQFAKQLHPDKNGGTEEAKQRFQLLKKRYERLKKVRSDGDRIARPSKEPAANGSSCGSPTASGLPSECGDDERTEDRGTEGGDQ